MPIAARHIIPKSMLIKGVGSWEFIRRKVWRGRNIHKKVDTVLTLKTVSTFLYRLIWIEIRFELQLKIGTFC
jgi:hypothetical protein